MIPVWRVCCNSALDCADARIPGVRGKSTIRIAALFAIIFVISLLHYETPTTHTWLHPLFQRAYYIPLLLMALWYGWRGGLLAATVTAILYIPHIEMAWHEHGAYAASQWLELVMFFVIAALTGVLAEHERGQRLKAEEMARMFKEANTELQASFELLRRADRLSAMGELAAGLAHEIRNPLGSIDGAVQILLRDQLPPGTKQEFGELARRELERLKGILNRFLNYARPQPPQRIETDPIVLISSIAKLAEQTARLAGVEIDIKAEQPIPMIAIDAEQIKQVLLNLVINAVQAMPSGGRIELHALMEGGALRLEVRDEGIGIAPADVERIFNPFFTAREGGTGLGLSIAERIVSQHDGRIEMRQNQGRGSTFSVVLPAAGANVTAAATPEAS